VKVEPSLEVVRDLVARIRATGVPYFVVGGQAVQSEVSASTTDVDVMVAVRDFDTLILRLKGDEKFGTPVRAPWIAKYAVHTGPRHDDETEVDVLNGRRYCGNRKPDEFFDYILEHWTIETDLGPSARIAVVWYTRLLARHRGDVYLYKIARDRRAGAPLRYLDDVRTIADRFGTQREIDSQIARLKEILGEDDGPSRSAARE